MKISIFTPTHNIKYLMDCYESLRIQTYKDWEWVIFLNGEATAHSEELESRFKDEDRIKIVVATAEVKGVGEAKHIACAHTTGDILVELDHDDYLHPNALEEIEHAFEVPNIGFVYSQFTQVDEFGKPNTSMYDPAFGWEYSQWEYKGDTYVVANGFDPHPHNLAYIWYAPNHLRAFRKSVYQKVGGYNTEMDVLDDQELMYRMYLETNFHYIKKPLYFQRIHGNNTQSRPDLNAKIQTLTKHLYLNSIEEMMKVWCRRRNLLALDLGSAHGKPDGYTGIDLLPAEGVDLVGDIFDALGSLADNSVGLIRAVDFLEHIGDKVKLIKEIYRVLNPNGMLISLTPSTDGRGAFQDPTHIAFYNENSFWYYTRWQRKYVDELKDISFQESYLATEFLSQWHKENNIPYVRAYICPLKGGPRLAGLLYN